MPGKVLFISSFVGQNYSGGSVAALQNLKICAGLFDRMEIDAYGFSFRDAPLAKGVTYFPSHGSAFSTFVNYSFGNAGSLTFSNLKTILALFENNNYAAVFLDGSLLGKLAKKIKQRRNKVIILSFFHNIEKQFFKSKLLGHPLWLPLYLSATYNEKLSAEYSDYILCFNSRDACGIEKNYHKKVKAILPVVVNDRLNMRCVDNLTAENNNSKTNLLFVGSDFFANIEGLRWFVRNVMPAATAVLTVAGRGMEKYRKELENGKVEVPGTVEDLDKLYYSADIVVAPIFSGSGMKTKTAEALMMGKTIAATTEAWQGYHIPKNPAGFVCNTAADFIQVINSRGKNCPKFNKEARTLYEKYYSPQSLQPLIGLLAAEIKQRIL